MRTTYFAAGILCLVAVVIRTVAGESQVLVLASEEIDTPALLGFVHLTWYLVTAVFALAAVALFRFGLRPEARGASVLAAFLGWLFLLWAGIIVSAGFTFGWHRGTIIPSVVTVLIGSLCLLGARKHVGEAQPGEDAILAGEDAR